MKRFNRKKFIPSLAASVMVAAATLAPLPLAAGSVVHAHPAFLRPAYLRILSPAQLAGSNISVENKYLCFPGDGGNTTGAIFVSASQTASQSGSGQAVTYGAGYSNVNCDGKPHIVTVTVLPYNGSTSFNVGRANTGARLYDPDNIIVAQDNDAYELHTIRVV